MLKITVSGLHQATEHCGQSRSWICTEKCFQGWTKPSCLTPQRRMTLKSSESIRFQLMWQSSLINNKLQWAQGLLCLLWSIWYLTLLWSSARSDVPCFAGEKLTRNTTVHSHVWNQEVRLYYLEFKNPGGIEKRKWTSINFKLYFCVKKKMRVFMLEKYRVIRIDIFKSIFHVIYLTKFLYWFLTWAFQLTCCLIFTCKINMLSI